MGLTVTLRIVLVTYAECEGWEPPRRQWVGLTDEEVKYLTSHFDWRAPIEQFVPVIEARLKEKNT
jgi:hypothetical protein